MIPRNGDPAAGDVRIHIARAVLDPGAPVPDGLGHPGTPASARRFAVYRNNVVAGLIEAVTQRFPACRAIVGDDFFRVMARAFVLACPPRSPVLLQYGGDFPAFVASFAPAADVPYLADVARVELARGEAYHAADAPAATADRLAALEDCPPAAVGAVLHPAVRLVRSHWPVATLWAMNAGLEPLAPVTDWCGEDVLVARPAHRVEVHRLAPGVFAFLAALAAGGSFETAMSDAFAESAIFEPGPAVASLVALGLATCFTHHRSRS